MQPKNPMSVVSVNVGLPREVIWRGETISTGIFKQPVQGRVAVRRLNLDGDRQADLTVHGGPDKAIYAYPAEYYHFWREEFPDITTTALVWREPNRGLFWGREIVQFMRGSSSLIAVRQQLVPSEQPSDDRWCRETVCSSDHEKCDRLSSCAVPLDRP